MEMSIFVCGYSNALTDSTRMAGTADRWWAAELRSTNSISLARFGRRNSVRKSLSIGCTHWKGQEIKSLVYKFCCCTRIRQIYILAEGEYNNLLAELKVFAKKNQTSFWHSV